MKEKPILFSTEMVKAILAGRKSQTRRVMKPQPEVDGNYMTWRDRRGLLSGGPKDKRGEWPGWWFTSPHGLVGDQLWVRETWATPGNYDDLNPTQMSRGFIDSIVYRASEKYTCYYHWRPAIFMPRWASRLTLEITNIGVERVQDISEEGAMAEGVIARHTPLGPMYRPEFVALWDSINAKRGHEWAANPWVWCISFKTVRR